LVLGFGVWGFGFWGLGLGVWGLGFVTVHETNPSIDSFSGLGFRV
jgi:hypothetical protein